MRKISMFMILLSVGIGSAAAASSSDEITITDDASLLCTDLDHGISGGIWGDAENFQNVTATHTCRDTITNEEYDCLCCATSQDGCSSGYIYLPGGCYCERNNDAEPVQGASCTPSGLLFPKFVTRATWEYGDSGTLVCTVQGCSDNRAILDNDCFVALEFGYDSCKRMFSHYAASGAIKASNSGPFACVAEEGGYYRCGCNDISCERGYMLEWNANYGGKMCVSKLGKPCNEKPTGVAEGEYRESIDGEYWCGRKKCYCHATKCTDANFTLTDDGKCIESTSVQEVVVVAGEGGDEVTKEPIEPEVVTQDITQQPVDTKSISDLAGSLAKVEGQFGLSKWRTADGEFNKARLASDLTAGVVLGTTGALVTSSVVKKKQVKEGFEALECTVGGQHVGDWGDVFRIDGK